MPFRSFRTPGTGPRISDSASARVSEDVTVMNIQTDNTSLATGTAVDIKRILQMIPHRYPMLMVDRVVDMQLDHSAVGIKNVSINEPFFQGHFPSEPVMPGDRLELHVEKVQSRANVWKFSGKALVEGKVAAEATFAAMIRDRQ